MQENGRRKHSHTRPAERKQGMSSWMMTTYYACKTYNENHNKLSITHRSHCFFRILRYLTSIPEKPTNEDNYLLK